MSLTFIQYLSGLGCGALVGYCLGLFGSGGSILAVPLMVHLVGTPTPQVAIGTSAFAVTVSAATNLYHHLRASNVSWSYARYFVGAGIPFTYVGSTLSKSVAGEIVMTGFAVLMIAAAVLMVTRSGRACTPSLSCPAENAPRVVVLGAFSGFVAGFAGIGGGFIIVPALCAATGLPTLLAVGTSLVAVAAFGTVTAINYGLSGLIDWPLATVFIAGAFLGGRGGAASAQRLAKSAALNWVFAAAIVAVAVYTLLRA